MNRKTRTLSAEDRRAVDLLLDQAAVGQPSVRQVNAGVNSPRLAAAARLLATLDALPAAEPPADLVRRTLDRVAAADLTVAQPATAVLPALLH